MQALTFLNMVGLPKVTHVAEVHNWWSSISFERRSASPTRGEPVESENRNYLQVTWPVEHGYREDLGGYEAFVGLYLPREAQGQPTRTEDPANWTPNEPESEQAEGVFEEYDFRGVYVAIQAVLTLHAQGKEILSIEQLTSNCARLRRNCVMTG